MSAKLTAADAKGDKRGVEQALKDVKDSHLPIKSKSKSLAARAPPDQSRPHSQRCSRVRLSASPTGTSCARPRAHTTRRCEEVEVGRIEQLDWKEFRFPFGCSCSRSGRGDLGDGRPLSTSFWICTSRS